MACAASAVGRRCAFRASGGADTSFGKSRDIFRVLGAPGSVLAVGVASPLEALSIALSSPDFARFRELRTALVAGLLLSAVARVGHRGARILGAECPKVLRIIARSGLGGGSGGRSEGRWRSAGGDGGGGASRDLCGRVIAPQKRRSRTGGGRSGLGPKSAPGPRRLEWCERSPFRFRPWCLRGSRLESFRTK